MTDPKRSRRAHTTASHSGAPPTGGAAPRSGAASTGGAAPTGRALSDDGDKAAGEGSARAGRRPVRPPIGSHLPATGGLATKAFRMATEMGAEALQVFVGNPRGWATSPGDPRQDEKFLRLCSEQGVAAYVHTPYLVNLGSPTQMTFERSVTVVGHNLARAATIGAHGVVVHTGSYVEPTGPHSAAYTRALRQVRAGLMPLLDALPDDGPLLLLEPTAGQGRSLCAGLDDLPAYLDALSWHPRVGVCLDTCHVFAAGAPLDVRGGMTRTLNRLTELIGRDRLRLIHANDCKDVRGSAKDRHERIGQGFIGLPAFRVLVRHPAVRDVSVVVETPGGPDAWAEDVYSLQGLRRH